VLLEVSEGCGCDEERSEESEFSECCLLIKGVVMVLDLLVSQYQ
jgi:hypothetical protein